MINGYLFSVETHILVKFRSTVSSTLSLLFQPVELVSLALEFRLGLKANVNF